MSFLKKHNSLYLILSILSHKKLLLQHIWVSNNYARSSFIYNLLSNKQDEFLQSFILLLQLLSLVFSENAIVVKEESQENRFKKSIFSLTCQVLMTKKPDSIFPLFFIANFFEKKFFSALIYKKVAHRKMWACNLVQKCYV